MASEKDYPTHFKVGIPDIDLKEATLGEVLKKAATQYGDRPLIIQAETGETHSYNYLDRRASQLANGLLEAFPNALKHVAILLDNSIDYLIASYALKRTGSVEVSINRAMRGPALARMIDLPSAQLIFTTSSYLTVLNEIRDSIPQLTTIIMLGDISEAQNTFQELKVISYNSLFHTSDDVPEIKIRATDPAAILFTSGTTGVSKGCVLSHRYAVRTAENCIPCFRVTAEDCVYSPYSLCHIGPAYYDVLPAMMTGGRAVIRNGFSLSSFWSDIRKYEVTWFLMLGSIQQLLYSVAPSTDDTNHKVTRCWSTPAPVPKKDFDERFGLHLIPGGGYGSTDAGWVATPQWDHPGAIVLPHFEVGIVDDFDNLMPPNTPGELVIRPNEPGVLSDCYFGMPEKTQESRRNLWFHTGDVAKLDEEGLLYFLHRMSERIRVLGEMVSAAEVEEGVVTHPAVADCAVIGVPAELGEEDIKVFVTLKPESTLTLDELRDHCRSRMAKYMLPAQLVILDEMPLTPTGKPEKGKLAKHGY